MSVPMMDVGEMRVRVNQILMPMTMRVRLAGRVVWAMSVLVMLVMIMQMLVFHRLVPVQVFVALGKVQPNPDTH